MLFTCLSNGVPSRPTPSATGQNLQEGEPKLALGQGPETCRGVADSGKESVRTKVRGALNAAR